MDTENDRHDRDSHYFDERDNEGDLKKLHDTFDGRDRDGRESDWRDNIDRRNDRERDRPQRPDSRDSRTSRDSRNSRDSMREETKSITESLLHDRSSWADSPYDPDPREEKMRRDDRRETSSGRNPPYMQQRHIPGPITREKLEASEQRNEAKRNLIPLVRSDKKAESLKKTDSQMDKAERKMTNDNENTSDVWSRNSNVTSVSSATPLVPLESESWADATEEVILKPSQSLAPTSGSTLDKHTNIKTELDDTKNTTELQPQQQLPQSLPSSSPPPPPSTPAQLPEEQTTQSSQKVSSVDSTDPSVKKSDESEISGRPEKSSGGRGGRGGRSNDGRSKDAWGNNTYAVYNRANYGPRGGESRGRRGSGRGVPRSHSARGCVHSESEVSGDEISVSASISTESGKEERRDRRDDRRIVPRSPKQGSRKPDRDDRNHDSRREGEKSYPSGSDGRRYDKRSSYDNSRNSTGSGGNREGFAPRGEPSRRGRGGFRTRGVTRVNTGSNCVYGAPRKPFFSSSDSTGKLDDKEKNLQAQSSSKDSEHNPDAMSSADDKMKLNQQALAAGIIGGRQNSKSSNVPPRMQRKSESEKRERRKSREGRGRARHLHQTHHGDPQQQGQTQRNDQGEDCAWETTSENSEGDDRDDNKHHDDNSRRRNYHSSRHPTSSGRTGRRNNPSSTARGGGDKRSYERKERNSGSGPPGGNGGNSQQMNGSGRQGPGGPGKNREINAGDNKSGDQHGLNRNEKDKANNLDGLDLTNIANSGGFKEVRSKKNMKQQQGQKLVDEKPSASLRGGSGGNKDRNKSGPMKNSSANNQLPGSATVTSVGGGMQMNSQPSSKNYNSRPKKLPPRFERQKEKQKANQQQHQQQQQVQQQYDVAEMNKLNQSVTLFPIKDMPAPTATQNAWEKPIAPSLRNSSNSSPPAALQLTSALANSTDNSCSGGGGANTGVVDVQDRPQSGASSQRSSPTSNEKLVNKIGRETIEKAVLDGTTPPVQTIIFENTNYKSTPGDQIQAMKNKFKNQKMDRSRGGERKVESIEENSHTIGLSGYKPSGTDIKGQENKADPIQMPISFGKSEDSADMKLDFFDTELLTDDKTSKSISLQRSLNTAQNSAADLNFKIASVKKVWDQPPLGTGSVMEHHTEDGNVVSTSSSFTPTFGNAVEDPTSYVKPVDHSSVVQGEDGTSLNAGEIVYSGSGQCQTVPVPGAAGSYVSAVPNMMKPDAASSASSNVCKVKPQPAAAMPSNHSVQLSPPPYNSSSAQPGGHINYQATAQFNSMSAIPSPPTVLYNTHANQQMPAQGDIYQTAFQLSNTTPVLGGQARSQFTQFAGPYVSSLSSTNAFSQQSVYLHQTATHPPSAPPACPELYQTTLSQYRITAPPAAFGQSQQLNSNSPMLISSSANSHMSPTVVKPASQQIGAIGSKAPPYQASAPSQMYMYPDPMMSQNFLSNSQLMQQRPANNVVPQQIQASSSFYSAPAGSQTGGFFNPASSNLPSAAQQLHQTQFSMPYGSTQSPANLQNYGSQYRQPGPGPGGPNPSYLKSSNMTQQHVTDPAKSPSTNQPDVMNSVFSASQIPSPKSRSAGGGGGGSGPTKQPGQQPSPPQSHHKFSSYQTLPQALHQQQQSVQQQAVQQRGGQMSVTMVRGNVAGQTPRYPAPIQRPVPYQTLQQQTTNNPGNNNNSANNTSHNGNNNQGRHRQNTRIPPTSTQALINKMPPSPATSPYYSAGQAGGGGGNVSVKLDGPNANNNAVSNSTGGLESKNENICKVNDNSNAANKQQAATADSSKDPHDSHNTSATND